MENMILLCYPCHRAIHMDEISAAHIGWISWVDPYVTPVLHARVGWTLLVPDGGFELLTEVEALRLIDYVNGQEAQASAS